MNIKSLFTSKSIAPRIEQNFAKNHSKEQLSTPSLSHFKTNECPTNMTRDLMKLIGTAIEEWSKKYNLDNLPKKIVFQQALSAMNAMNKIFESTDR